MQRCRRTRGTETSHYPQEKKTTVIPPVAASERGGAQTGGVSAPPGSWDRDIRQAAGSAITWKGKPRRVIAPCTSLS